MIDDLTKQVKRALRAKGYVLPRPFRTDADRMMFIAKRGYDPAILINSTIRMMDATGAGWEECIDPYEKPPIQEGVRETKARRIEVT